MPSLPRTLAPLAGILAALTIGGVVASGSAQQASTLPRPGTYSLTTTVRSVSCPGGDTVGAEVAYTGTVNAQGATITLTTPDSTNWRTWTGSMNGDELALTSMQQSGASRREHGQWRGVSYLHLDQLSRGVWSGSGVRMYQLNGRICQTFLSVGLRKL